MQVEAAILEAEGRCLPMWIDFYETRQSRQVLVELDASRERMSGRTLKLIIAGCLLWAKFRLRYRWRRDRRRLPCPVQFFDDPEYAKSWLVGKEL